MSLLYDADADRVNNAYTHGTDVYSLYARGNPDSVGDVSACLASHTGNTNDRVILQRSRSTQSGSNKKGKFNAGFNTAGGSFAGFSRWTTDADIFEIGKWTGLGVTYSGASSSNDPIFYVDGVVSASTKEQSASPNFLAEAASFRSGETANGFAAFRGKVADVAVWNRILTSAEMAVVHFLGPLLIPDGLKIYWPFTDFGAANARDFSGNGNNGAITGATLAEDPPRLYPASTWETFAVALSDIILTNPALMLFTAQSPGLAILKHRRTYISDQANLGRFVSVALERTGDASEFELHALTLRLTMRSRRRWVNF